MSATPTWLPEMTWAPAAFPWIVLSQELSMQHALVGVAETLLAGAVGADQVVDHEDVAGVAGRVATGP